MPGRRGLPAAMLLWQILEMRLLCILLSLGLLLPTAWAKDNSRPNFIVILVDDLGWMDLSCQGNDYFQTPNIDRLATEGMRFTDAYAACAVCSPTRAAIQTGRYPGRIGVTDWIRARFQRGRIGTPNKNPSAYVGSAERRLLCPPNPYWMEHNEITLAEVLKKHGYKTAHIGKWHLGDEAWYPTRQGYEVNRGGCDYGQPPSYFDPFTQPNHKHQMIRQGIPHLEGKKKGQYLTDREAEEAVQLIRRWKDKPFFIHLAHYAVHTPIQAEKAAVAKYQQAGKSEANAKYAAMVESVDRATGKILDTLGQLGLAEKTLLLFTSDNGGLDRNGNPTENAPLRSGKGYAYEGGIRVPFLARWPGQIPAGKTSAEPINSIDIFPTILKAAAIPPPADRPIDGLSLLAHLRSGGKKPLNRDALFWHFPHYRHEPGPYSIIRKGSWKLIHFHEGIRELYHLGNDLGERRNLAAERSALAGALEAELKAALDGMGALQPRPNPNHRPVR